MADEEETDIEEEMVEVEKDKLISRDNLTLVLLWILFFALVAYLFI